MSRDWSGKTLAEHKADRATVVREALLSAGVAAPEIERMAADVKASDGLPRVGVDRHEARLCQLHAGDPGVNYGASSLAGTVRSRKAVDNRSATSCGGSPPFSASGGLSPPISPPSSDSCDAGSEGGSSRVKSVGRECSEAPLTG